jgi:hypothetical protein
MFLHPLEIYLARESRPTIARSSQVAYVLLFCL